MTLYLLEQPDKTWHVYEKSNEFLVGVIAETPLGPYFVPYQGPEIICWTPDALEKLASMLKGLEMAKLGVDFPEHLAVGVN